MIPLRGEVPRAAAPLVTWAIVLSNAAVFLGGEPAAGLALGLVPAEALSLAPESAPTWLTHMFVHGGWLHVVGNLWFLWVFGPAVEGALGRPRFLLFYLACGLAAALAHVLTHSQSPVPMVGASGALAGVLGAYVVWFPGARIQTLLPLPLIFLVDLPAYVFLGVWAALQLLNATASIGSDSGVAWFAHLGGFTAGLLYALARRPRRVRLMWR